MENTSMLKGQAVCKDCGNGTLNNELNPQFEVGEVHGYETVVCLRCGRSHVDGELYMDEAE
jgi:ribosomal protein L37E